MRRSLVVLLFLSSSSLWAQAPEPAPGLHIPVSSLPYALDHFQGQSQLVPIHHSSVEVNNHKGANVAGSLAGSVFYKPKLTFEVAGEHARTTLHDAQPSFYVRVLEDPDGSSDDGHVFAIVRAIPDKDRRVFAQVRFTQLTGNAKRNDGTVEVTVEHPSGGWLKITPQAQLSPGEYALTPIPKAQNAFSSIVFDFAIDPSAANDTDVVTPDEER